MTAVTLPRPEGDRRYWFWGGEEPNPPAPFPKREGGASGNRSGFSSPSLLRGGGRGERFLPPLLLFLHGTGGTAPWAVEEANLVPFAAAAGFALAAADARPPDPSKPVKFLTNPPRWNDGSDAPVPEMVSTVDDVGFLADVIADACRRGADPNRVLVAGFSNGAGMAFRLAAERADLVAAVVPVAGLCWIDPKPSRPVPTLYLVGELDPLIPPRGGDVRLPWGNRLVHRLPPALSLEKWATANGCSPTPVTEGDAEVYPGPVPIRAMTLPGHGHHWPGGKGQLNPRIGGPNNPTLDANRMIADWFRQV